MLDIKRIKNNESGKMLGYYSVLGFDKEPFATSPDPEFFYHTREHDLALTNLLIELRLRRGLSVIFGDVGTGKTTLSRKLLHELNKRGDMIFHMILDPSFTGQDQFLVSLARNFNIDLPKDVDLKNVDILELRDTIEAFLLQKTLEEKRTIILLIDEAQKLDLTTLETLRILLNFETNEQKLIQLVLLGQLELYSKVVHMNNFVDRISFKFTLNPLDVKETGELINFRVKKAGYKGEKELFTNEAISAVYNYTKGYPRKINMLCHKCLKEVVMRDQAAIDVKIVEDVIQKEQQWLTATKNSTESLTNIQEINLTENN
ncbi:MAG: AAA family ATPase [Candidatus Omnitrophica bacterium]|nr:AAA family ATPase [Candidatus Omnitrophota bacterium]